MAPEIRYAKSGDVHIAYQAFGTGPVDLVIIPGFISNIEHYWDWPEAAHWLDHLAARARVILFDKRGTGLSDRLGQLPGLEQRRDDARAVMDAAGVERAGVSEGGSLAVLFAAAHPERCSALVLYGAFARFSDWFPTKQKLDLFLTMSTQSGVPVRALRRLPRRRRAIWIFNVGGAGGKTRRQPISSKELDAIE